MPTRASRCLAMSLTWLLDSFSIPSVFTSPSTRRVLTPSR